jgi:hypothetical protein
LNAARLTSLRPNRRLFRPDPRSGVGWPARRVTGDVFKYASKIAGHRDQHDLPMVPVNAPWLTYRGFPHEIIDSLPARYRISALPPIVSVLKFSGKIGQSLYLGALALGATHPTERG